MVACVKYFKSSNPLMMGVDKWAISMTAAKAVYEYLKELGELAPGMYWESQYAREYRSAVRRKLPFMMIRTAGFSTSELNNRMAEVGVEVIFADD